MGYFRTETGVVMEIDVPEGVHQREWHDAKLRTGELVELDPADVEAVEAVYGFDRNGDPLTSTTFREKADVVEARKAKRRAARTAEHDAQEPPAGAVPGDPSGDVQGEHDEAGNPVLPDLIIADDLTKAQLIELASARGISVPARSTVPEIRELLAAGG